MSKQIKILIVEDEFISRRHLKKSLLEMGYLVPFDVGNAKQATETLENEEIDFAILDINLGEHKEDGIFIGSYIKNTLGIPFIYLTAYDTNNVLNQALETTPSAYLTKPFNNAELRAAIEIAFQKSTNLNQDNKDLLTVKENNCFVQIDANEIDFIESRKNYIILHSQNKEYKYRATIKSILELLPENNFKQSHRAFVVNKNSITKFTKSSLFIGKVEISISLGFRDNFEDLLT